jgi:hypothetical protein
MSTNDGEPTAWCELDTGKWHLPDGAGCTVVLGGFSACLSPAGGLLKFLAVHSYPDAPIRRCPTLVRSGGILILGGKCHRNIYDGLSSRTALLFPTPASSANGCSGRLTLIEDDGCTNAHTASGIYTELDICFKAEPKSDRVEVWIEVRHVAYKLPYDTIWFQLPIGDDRTVCLSDAGELRKGKSEDERTVWGMNVGLLLRSRQSPG